MAVSRANKTGAVLSAAVAVSAITAQHDAYPRTRNRMDLGRSLQRYYARKMSMPEIATPWMMGGSHETRVDRSINLLPCAEFIEDGALGAITPLACFDQTTQDDSHVLKSLDASIQFSEMSLGQPANCLAATLFVAPEFEQFPNFFDWKTKQPCPLDEAELVDVPLFVGAVAVRLPIDRLEQTDAFIIADQFDGYPGQSCGVADTEHARASLSRDWSLPLLETLGSMRQVLSLTPARQSGEGPPHSARTRPRPPQSLAAAKSGEQAGVNTSNSEPGELRTKPTPPSHKEFLS